MGSTVHLIVVGGPAGIIDLGARRIDNLECRWSRFVPGSEIDELNRLAGTPAVVSAETALLVQRAVDAWRLTQGWFDPTVLGAVIRAGYDRSFEELGPNHSRGHSELRGGAGGIQIAGNSVCIPAGVGIDPGGIGKGLAADLVASELLSLGAAGVCVNMGGDVRVAGSGPTGAAWTVAIEYPWAVEAVANVGLADGAVATSTTLKRRWEIDGQSRHHLIDPHTGKPSTTDLTLVTVVADQAWRAEVLAKTVLLHGSPDPFGLIGKSGAQALSIDMAGRIEATSGFADFLGDATLPKAIEPGSLRSCE